MNLNLRVVPLVILQASEPNTCSGQLQNRLGANQIVSPDSHISHTQHRIYVSTKLHLDWTSRPRKNTTAWRLLTICIFLPYRCFLSIIYTGCRRRCIGIQPGCVCAAEEGWAAWCSFDVADPWWGKKHLNLAVLCYAVSAPFQRLQNICLSFRWEVLDLEK